MEKYKKAGYTVISYDFDSLHQFLAYIQNAPINTQIFTPSKCSSQSTVRRDWYGTGSFKEAVELCQTGWSKKFKSFVRVKNQIDRRLIEDVVSQRQINDVIGHNPSVPDYLCNNPLNMWNRTNIIKPKFVEILVNIAYNCGTQKNAIFNRGAIVLSLVDALENRGYTVRLKLFECRYHVHEIMLNFFNLKDDGEKLNIKKAYFPLCHPSFLRRLIFKLTEVAPVEYLWSDGYGIPSDVALINKIMDTDQDSIIIVQPEEMKVSGYSLEQDLEAILKFTNLQNVLTKA